MKVLLKEGADLTAKEERNYTVLHASVIYRYGNIIEILPGHGINAKANGHDGRTTLHMTSWSGYKGVVKLLVRNGVDIKVKTSLFLQLAYLTYRGPYRAVKILSRAKAIDDITIWRCEHIHSNADSSVAKYGFNN